MNEFELIEKYFSFKPEVTPALDTGVVLGVGDDACVLNISQGQQLVVSVDTLIADVHFPADAPADRVATRALSVCLSDLAAMGAKAKWFTLALTLPGTNAVWLEVFSRSLAQTAARYRCHLVGGDTTRGPLSITLQVMGEVRAEEAFTRSRAEPGDSVYVTGCLGDAAAALAVLQDKLRVAETDRQYLLSRYYFPEVRFAEAGKIRGIAKTAIDISDGLIADLGHICKQSQVGAIVDVTCLPYSENLQNCSTEKQREDWALTGGDDYELCFTVSAEKRKLIDEMTLSGSLQAMAIGKITQGDKVQCYRQDQLLENSRGGYMHFCNAE